uniref:Uncharacterized protein n=1 Tax=Periophthalmus magnuspinnatus TaxID=409849 RepID=A0A3B3ZCL2_9GOBI
MFLQYYQDENGDRVYTLKVVKDMEMGEKRLEHQFTVTLENDHIRSWQGAVKMK